LSATVIADTIGSFATGFTLTGALVTLTRSPLAVAASAPLRISASPAAVERAGRGPLRFVASFRPVAAGPGSLGPCP
jgi:hypothetical protein